MIDIKKFALLVLTLAVLLTSTVRADSFYGDYPNPVDTSNTYADGLVRTRTSLDQSISGFWAAYTARPYNYWSVVQAYYGYVNAYYTYRGYLNAYDQAEVAGRAFKGRVMTRDLDPGQMMPMIYPWPGFSVQGAQVELSTVVPPGQGRPVQLIGTRTTDASGAFSFDGLASGSYAYTVTKDGFRALSGTVDLSGGSVTQTLYVNKQSVISGTVVTPQLFGAQPIDWNPANYPPRPVAGARVSMTYVNNGGIQNWMSILRTTTTDANGRFSFDGIPANGVRITVEAPDYVTATNTYSLTQRATDVQIVLQSSLPPPPIAMQPLLASPAATSGQTVNDAFGR